QSFALDPAGAFAYVSAGDVVQSSFDCTMRLVIDPNTGDLSQAESWVTVTPDKLQLDPLHRFIFERFGLTFSSVSIASKTGHPLRSISSDTGQPGPMRNPFLTPRVISLSGVGLDRRPVRQVFDFCVLRRCANFVVQH